jgi:hypothetical protein
LGAKPKYSVDLKAEKFRKLSWLRCPGKGKGKAWRGRHGEVVIPTDPVLVVFKHAGALTMKCRKRNMQRRWTAGGGKCRERAREANQWEGQLNTGTMEMGIFNLAW